MDMQIILLWIGLFITFVLGLVNFLYGGGILSRRDRVSVREGEVDTGMVLHRKDTTPYLWVKGSFKLVRISGDRDLYLESAYIQLDEMVCEKLSQHIVLPPDNRVYWGERYHEIGSNSYESRRLKANEPKKFKIRENFIIQDSLIKMREKEEREGRAIESPEITDNLLRIKSKFKIVWKDSRGKEWQHRFPTKWYNKFLPERLWWRIA